MSGDKYDLYRKLNNLKWFCSDCDAVAYGHYNPCLEFDISKERKKIMEELDKLKGE